MIAAYTAPAPAPGGERRGSCGEGPQPGKRGTRTSTKRIEAATGGARGGRPGCPPAGGVGVEEV